MRLLIVLGMILLILTACAPASPQANPTSVPPEPSTAPADVTSEVYDTAVKATLETSLLATEWNRDSRDNVLFPVDPASGTALSAYTPISLGKSSFHAFSPDRRTLAVVSFPNDIAYNGSLLLIDLESWSTRRLELDLDGWVSTMVFNPDGKQLAIAHGQSSFYLTMINVEEGTVATQKETEPFVTQMKFTTSGEELMLYRQVIENRLRPSQMSAGAPQVLLLDAADLSPLWSAELKEVRDGLFPKDETVTAQNLYEPGKALSFSPGLAFAHDQDVLYVVHPDSEKLTTVNFESKKVEMIEIRTKLTWFEWLLSLTTDIAHAKFMDGTTKQAVVSPDGQYLYIIGINNASFQDQQGQFQMEQTPLGLEIIQTSDGSRVAHVETDATELSLSPDGRFLYLRNWVDTDPWTEIFDTTNRQLIARKELLYARPARLMNGQSLLVSTYVASLEKEKFHMSILQPSDLSVLADWEGSDFIYWLTP